MRKRKYQEQPQHLKQKLMSALSMFLVATVLMTSTTYAWFVMSTAPEVSGITTNVGANGSLEIALLNAETHADLSAIRASVGTSATVKSAASNYAWGNLVDLSYREFGLDELLLLPSRLMVQQSGTSYTVNSNLLSVPVYGYDGRVERLEEDTVSAVYTDGQFASGEVKDYGVRAIGTSDLASPQASVLKDAKSDIPNQIDIATKKTTGSLEGDVSTLITNLVLYSSLDAGNLTILQRVITALNEASNAITFAMKQGLLAYAAAGIPSQETFKAVRDQIDSAADLSALLEQIGAHVEVPETFATWVTDLTKMNNNLNEAQIALNDLKTTGADKYTNDQVQGVMNSLINLDSVKLSVDGVDKTFSDLKGMRDELMGAKIVMILAEGSGIYAEMAKFVGQYQTTISVAGMVNIDVMTVVKDAYLPAMNAAVQELTPAGGGDVQAVVPLDNTYGYAIDLAFRCNAADPDLLLQTGAIQRVYTDSESASTQGGGSYMAFSSKDQNLSENRKLALMDAIRVAFVDSQFNILAVAKPNITTAITEEGMLKAPLYLYDYTFEPDENDELLISFGERRLVDNLITDLDQNVPKAVTAVVWLDGDIVDNTMVSATEVASLNGVLNLQFATSAKLIPGQDADLFEYDADISPLTVLLDGSSPEYNTELNCVATYNEGRLNWTTVSWNNYVAAYDRAMFLYKNNPSEVQAREAALDLAEARRALEPVSKEAISDKIDEVRELTGSSDVVSGYVVDDELHTSYTEEQLESWKDAGIINSVDYTNNNLNKDNGIDAPIYSDETWSNLANALYYAEYIKQKQNASTEEVNEALTQLENAYKALEYEVVFHPYTYKDTIYYKIDKPNDDSAGDVYGDWYDANYNRVLSEVMMLTLDGYAEPITVMAVNGETYLEYGNEATKYVTIKAELLSSVYPELMNTEIKGVIWDAVDSYYAVEMMGARHNAILTRIVDLVKEEGLDQLKKEAVDLSLAEKMLAAYKSYEEGSDTLYTAAEVEAEIAKLEAAMEPAREYKATQLDAPATETQKTLLNIAITTGQNYLSENAGSTAEGMAEKLDRMTTVLDAVVPVASNEAMTYKEAKDAFRDINNALKFVGLPKVNEYNSIVHVIPGPEGSETIVYDTRYTDLVLKVYNSGTTTLKATILTKDGVVDNASKQITIYDGADGLMCFDAGHKEVDSENPIRVEPLKTTAVSANIYYKQDLPGVVDKFLKDPSLLVREDVVEYIWATGNPDIASVDENGVITGHISGETTLSVSARTLQGNTYALRNIPILVYIPAESVSCYDGETEVTAAAGIDMNGGDSIILTGSINYADTVAKADRETIEYIGFTTPNEDILQIKDNGTITALTGGNTSVTMVIRTAQRNTYTMTIPVRIPYEQAIGAKAYNGTDEVGAGKGITLSVEGSVKLAVELLFAQPAVPETPENPEVPEVPQEPAKPLPRESVKYYTLEAANPETVQIAEDGSIVGLAAGWTTVTMTVHTVQGNTFVINNISVSVK